MKDEEDDLDWSGAEKAAQVGDKPEPTMGDALDRAHDSGGKDTFGVVSSLPTSHIDDAVAMLDKPDAQTAGPVDPPPPVPSPEPPSVAPPPDGPPDFKAFPSPVAPKPDDGIRQARLSAIENIRKLIDAGPPKMSPQFSDEAISGARQRDEQAQARSDFSRALMALGARKPFESEPVKSEADSLMKQRGMSQAQGSADLQRKLSGEESIARLSEDKPVDPTLEALRLAGVEKIRADTGRADTKLTDDEAAKKTTAELEAKKLAETTRHNQATEAQSAAALAARKAKTAQAKELGAAEIHSLEDIKDPSKRATVAAMLKETHLNTDGMMRTAAGRELMGLALQLKPELDQSKFGVSKAVSTQMATDKSVDALNTASNHLDELEKAVTKAGNFDSPTFNRIKNAFLNNTGSAAMTALETIGGTAAHEVAGAYGIATEGGRHEIEQMFSEAQSTKQLLERIHTQRALMGGKGQSMVHRAEAYGAQAPAIEPGVLHPESPASGTVTIMDKKSRRSRNVSPEKAKAIMAAPGGEGFEIVGEPNR